MIRFFLFETSILAKLHVIDSCAQLMTVILFLQMLILYILFLHFLSQENGLLHVPKGQTQNVQAQMFSDPNMAMDMMKKNLSMIIPQVYIFCDCYIHY